MSNTLSIGEATHLAQGYPTQIWAPSFDPRHEKGVALVHDRRLVEGNPGAIYFIPGNSVDQLLRPGREIRVVEGEDGVRRRLRIPDALLWSNHGGPCTSRGQQYHRGGLTEELILGAYHNLFEHQISEMSAKALEANTGYKGPFDYNFPASETDRLTLRPIPYELVAKAGLTARVASRTR